MIIGSDKLLFVGEEDRMWEVKEINSFEELKKDVYYIDYKSMNLYRYIGEMQGNVKKDLPRGCICKYGDRYLINRRTDDDEDYPEYSISNAKFENEFVSNKSSIEELVADYIHDYNIGVNHIKQNGIKYRNNGDLYIPEFKASDDILTRMMKRMIVHKKIKLKDYKGKLNKEYSLDNLRSALNGTTSSMTIAKFVDWCNLLGLYWKFEITNDPNIEYISNPLEEPLIIAKDKFLWEEFGEQEKGIYKVPCIQGEDPLKRIIKVAIIQKHISPSQYKNKGSSPHLLNNMMSALKRKSKMMILYFTYWCEILDLSYTFTIYDPETDHTETGTPVFESDELL